MKIDRILLGFLMLVPVLGGNVPAQGVDSDLREKLTDATVYIEAEVGLRSRDWMTLPEILRERIGDRPSGITSGSGFIISPDGTILTNAHVVQGFIIKQYPDGQTEQLPPGSKPIPFDPEHPDRPFAFEFSVSWVRVVTDSGTEAQRSYTATILRVDPQLDIAVLRVAAESDALPSLPLALAKELQAGDPVLMSGFPGGIYTELAPFIGGQAEQLAGTYSPRPSVNEGLVTAIREYQGAKRYQLDVRANPGNSGGPITDREGNVVAILYAQIGGMQSINYAIPIAYAWPLLPGPLRDQLGGGIARSEGSEAATDRGSQDYDEFLKSGRFEF